MLGRFFDFLRGRSVLIRGVGKLPEGQAKRIEIGDPLAGGTQVVLCRVDGELFALDVRCPHEGGRIIEGPLVEGRHAVCPLHNFYFDPKSGRPVRGVCANAKTYKVREKDGDCQLWL